MIQDVLWLSSDITKEGEGWAVGRIIFSILACKQAVLGTGRWSENHHAFKHLAHIVYIFNRGMMVLKITFLGKGSALPYSPQRHHMRFMFYKGRVNLTWHRFTEL